MNNDTIAPIQRNIPAGVITAFECKILPSEQIIPDRRVVSWKGTFSEERLREQIIPKLAQYAEQDWNFPFLIITHQLQKTTAAHFKRPITGRAKSTDIRIDHRKRNTEQIQVAIIQSRTQFKLLV